MITAALLALCTVAGQPPLTPGTTALLVGRDDDGYRSELQRAIASPDPIVRAVAARVAGVRHQGDMAGPLRAALAAETDPIATREQQEAIARLERGAAAPDAGTAVPATQTVRTFQSIAPGVLSSLMAAAGCKPARPGAAGSARITFDASGAVLRSEIDTSGLPAKCHQVLSTMARLAVAGEATSGVHSEYLLLPVDTDFVKCSDQSAADTPAGRPSGKLVPPRKTRDVRPAYPPGALAAGDSGVVWVVAHVTRSGCINDARVTRSLRPDLDVAAIRAVVGFGYEPARLGDTPVSSFVTTSVNFQIQR